MLADWSWRGTWSIVLAGCGFWLVSLILIHQPAAEILPAVLLCVGLTGFVIWYATLRVPWALVCFYCVTLFWVSTSLRTRAIGDVSLDWQNGSKFGLWGCVIMIAALNGKRIVPFLADHVVFWLVVYLVLGLLSIGYSEAPSVTAISIIIVLAYFGLGCVLIEALPVRTVIMTTLWTLTVYLLGSLAITVIVPSIGLPSDEGVPLAFRETTTRIQGLAGHPNQLAMITMYFFIVLVAAAYRGYLRYPAWLALGTLGLGIMLATHSRTPLFSIVLAGILQVPRRFLLLILGCTALIGGGVVIFGQTTTILEMIGRSGNAEEATTMSGRTDLWHFTEQLISQRPLLGYGYASFESYAKTAWVGDAWAAIVGPHNLYLLLLYSTGILGTLPWAIAFVILLYRWQTEPNLPRDFVTCTMLLYGFSEADLLGIAIVPTLTFLLVMLIDAKERLIKGNAWAG